MRSYLNVKILLWTSSLAIVDFIIKIVTVKSLGFLNPIKVFGEYIWIIATQNVTMQGFGSPIWRIAGILFMLLFMFVFFRIQTRDVSNGFKWASAMIVFAWIGSELDHFIISHESDNPEFYHNMDWLFDGVLTGAVTSITTLMFNGGWLLFIIMLVSKFKDLKKTLSKSATVSVMPQYGGLLYR